MYVSTSSSSSNETRSTYHCTSTSDYEETTDILIMDDSPFYGNLADVTDDSEWEKCWKTGSQESQNLNNEFEFSYDSSTSYTNLPFSINTEYSANIPEHQEHVNSIYYY